MKGLSLLLLACVTSSRAFPAPPGSDAAGVAEEYLQKYYKLNTEMKTFRRSNGSPLAVKLREMQQFFGLEVTGRMDADTLEVMRQPRCGVTDVEEYSTFPGHPKWAKTALTYRILNYTPDMEQADVDAAIEKAFEVWSRVTPLTFTRMYAGAADIYISFGAGYHGDVQLFDGPQGTLAHAFAPGEGIGGDAHFDEDESWTKGSEGASMHTVRPSTPRTPKTTCNRNMNFGAITTFRGETIFFKNKFIWRKIPNDPEVKQSSAAVFWPSLPPGIEAAYENPATDQIYFFKGSKFWAYRGTDLIHGYPKTIYHLGFPRSVKRIDAAVLDEDKGKTYFFVGNKYWSYDEGKQVMEHGFPRRIVTDFPGLVHSIQAVFQSDGFLYFFKGKWQYEFSPASKRVTRVLRSDSWFGCTEE